MGNAKQPIRTRRRTYTGCCRHCKTEAKNHGRGLCWACYRDPEVRRLYPVIYDTRRGPEPTQEEVDRLVAEGYAHLPDWWPREVEKMDRGEPDE